MNMKILLAFVIILGLLVLSGCENVVLTQQDSGSKQGADAQQPQTGEPAAIQQAQQQTGQQAEQKPDPGQDQPVRVLSKTSGNSNVLYDGDVIFATFPTVIMVPLQEQTEVSVEFEADKEIQLVVYNEFMYNKWKETGKHVIAKANTKQGDNCCAASATFKFDVNNGEGGNYYIIFDDSAIADKSNLPTKAKLKVTKLGGQ